MATQEEIFAAIGRERLYQDCKWGIHGHGTVIEWQAIAYKKLNDADRAIGEDATKRELLQAAAVIVACLEQHGIVEREFSMVQAMEIIKNQQLCINHLIVRAQKLGGEIAAQPVGDVDWVDWSKVPDKYNYVAADSNGVIYQYKNKPTIDGPLWLSENHSYNENHELEAPKGLDWRNSLRERPF